MLTEVRCNEFKSHGEQRQPIVFHTGLNTILGSESGSNSIGKSTFLMIVDFVFGGDDYITKSTDVQTQVGRHTIQFAFEFEGKKHWFSRDTHNSTFVSQCDSDYNALEEIPIKDYRSFLYEKYKIGLPSISFRDVISTYLRIYKRENYNESHPLKAFLDDSDTNGIDRLIKLFDKYAPIAEMKKSNKELTDKRDALKQAKKFSYVPQINTQKQFKENEKELESLKKERETLTNSKDSQLLQVLGIDSVIVDIVSDLKGRLATLRRQRSRLNSQLTALENNMRTNCAPPLEDFVELSRFFSDINIQKIESIEHFHCQLQNVLSTEFEQEKVEICKVLELVEDEILAVEKEIDESGIPQKISKALLDKFAYFTSRIAVLEKTLSLFKEGKNLDDAVKSSKERLAALQGEQTHALQAETTVKMDSINNYLYGGQKKAPVLTITSPSRYTFTTPDDTGTGTAYKGLLVFDLSVLELTELPILVHDSLLFKNVEDEALEKIMELYQKSGKQIIIAMDKAHSYTNKTQEILEATSALKLSGGGNELFGRSWNIKE